MGRPKEIVLKHLRRGKNVVFDIDWQTKQIKNKKLKFKLILIYILPPSKKELYLRLIKRENNNKKL